MTSLPILGAALTLDEVESHSDWLRELPRDLELQSFVNAEVLMGDWQPLAARAIALLDGHKGRLGIHGPFWGFTLASPDPEVRAIVSLRMMQALDVCEAIGATQMVVHSPYTTWGYNNMDAGFAERDRIFDLVRATMAPALERADEIGVTFVLENIEDIDPLDRVRLAEALDWHSLAISVDTGHAHYACGSTGAPPVDYFVRAAGDHLKHVHLQDADGYADRHWQIGHGTILWPAVFAAIAKLNSNPRLILELRDKAGVIPSARYLQSLGLAQ